MDKKTRTRRGARTKRVRAGITGTAIRPRLAVSRSNKGIYLQLIDDEKGRTLVSASVREITAKDGTKTEEATLVGKLLAEKAVKAGIKRAVLDRRFYKYHGRVKAAAEGAKEGGLLV